MWYWRMAAIRVLIYGCIVAWGVFKAGVEGFYNWHDLTDMTKFKLYGDMSVAFGGVLLAFLDSSIARLIQGKPDAEAAVVVKKVSDAVQDAAIESLKNNPESPIAKDVSKNTT